MSKKEFLWEQQGRALRKPSELFGGPYESSGIISKTLQYSSSVSFNKLLKRLGVTLVVSREYENLLISLSVDSKNKIRQGFFHLPHPSGMAVDRKKNLLYVAATRNPNQIVEFRVTKEQLKRITVKSGKGKFLVPNRTKIYPGEYYFHDLALCGSTLYANSVGMNSIIPVDMADPKTEKPIWWPQCIDKKGKPDTRANFIQLNSIAIGRTIRDSFFSASGTKISSIRPGNIKYPVDKQGVIFSGKTGNVIGKGLTRPHSARLYKDKVWVANSGYGEVGYFEGENFVPVHKFNGWTRGLCFIGDHLFVGVSRVLPRFRMYAPGLTSVNQVCSVAAIDLKTRKVVGEIKFPYGNQVFSIDYLFSKDCNGFPFSSLQDADKESKFFSTAI